MRRSRRRVVKAFVLCMLLLFLYITRSLVQTVDYQFSKDSSIVANIFGQSDVKAAYKPDEIDAVVKGVDRNTGNMQVAGPRKYVNHTGIKHRGHGNISTLGTAIETVVKNIQKHVPPDRVEDQQKHVPSDRVAGQQNHNPYDEEYYVEEYGGEDSDVTYPPFVEHSPEDGPGEWGNAVHYKSTGKEYHEDAEGRRRNSFNQLVSDRISVRRRLPDNRQEECKSRVYPVDLPPASVIICFHNEAWSTLLRSVHSVLDRSPAHLIKEIVLVDDASTQDHLMAPLKKYMTKLGKVKIVRLRKQRGLIRARLIGNEVAAGPVLVFLDSHIECFPGWLEPQLDRIRTNPRNVPFPHIHVISSENFGTGMTSKLRHFGVFNWKMLLFNWGNISNKSRSQMTSPVGPIRSPTMPGGLFAIDKQWFTTLGTYDPGLLYWGGENIELSFKTWMCNGTLELLPCSHVGHIFRSKNPVKWEGGGNPILTNSMRVAEVWLDEYKYLFYEQTSLLQGLHNYGDITDRKKLRDSLHCHDFRWYIENVYPECPFPGLFNVGEVRSISNPTLCLDSAGRRTPALVPCHGIGGNQYWQLLPSGKLQGSNDQRLCIKSGELIQDKCFHDSIGKWTYTEDRSLQLSALNVCLTVGDRSNIVMKTCNGKTNQKWAFGKSKFRLKNR
ncbi:polypeptide N-acetylgalactosaminyltransferase 5-like [Haliotis rufescens]|uniref:polypeptide N-acetylgalactosaminyltransferase 5-like n=1 Tax=Haliotis rufescens TaxID=6454 RepID=UPI00201F2AA3|nr:polypeptide N-acetylgalactosaminyltransferase 5-like [Haliotis rufescens]